TPIIFVTANSVTETHVTRGYELGAVDYIFSPIVPEILRAKVAVLIELWRKSEQVRRQSVWLRALAEQRAHQRETRLRSLLDRLDVGVFRATVEGELLEVNPAFLALVGASSLEEARALDLPILLGTTPRGGIEQRVRDLELERPDGSVRWVGVTRTATEGAAG